MKMMMNFTRDLMRMPMGWVLWVHVLMAVNFGGLLFFRQLEAQITVGVFMVAATTLMVLHDRFGFVRLLGAGHFYWFALLPWLVFRSHTLQPEGAFGMWIHAVVVLNGLSLVLDVTDVARWLKGDREPQLQAA